MSLRLPTQTLHLQVKLLSLIKWKFLYTATANGLYAVRRVSAKVQAELLWPPATSKHNFLLSLQRHHASLVPEKEPPLFVQLTWTFFLVWQPAQSDKSLQCYSNILYRRYVRTAQFYDCLFRQLTPAICLNSLEMHAIVSLYGSNDGLWLTDTLSPFFFFWLCPSTFFKTYDFSGTCSASFFR